MRKLWTLPILASLIALAFGFAASLTIDDAPNLQVGTTETGALECADSAEVTAWMYDDAHSRVDGARVWLDEKEEGACEGEVLTVTPLDEGGSKLANLGGDDNSQGYALIDDTNFDDEWGYLVIFSSKTGYDGFVGEDHAVGAQALHGVRIAIEQGPDGVE